MLALVHFFFLVALAYASTTNNKNITEVVIPAVGTPQTRSADPNAWDPSKGWTSPDSYKPSGWLPGSTPKKPTPTPTPQPQRPNYHVQPPPPNNNGGQGGSYRPPQGNPYRPPPNSGQDGSYRPSSQPYHPPSNGGNGRPYYPPSSGGQGGSYPPPSNSGHGSSPYYPPANGGQPPYPPPSNSGRGPSYPPQYPSSNGGRGPYNPSGQGGGYHPPYNPSSSSGQGGQNYPNGGQGGYHPTYPPSSGSSQGAHNYPHSGQPGYSPTFPPSSGSNQGDTNHPSRGHGGNYPQPYPPASSGNSQGEGYPTPYPPSSSGSSHGYPDGGQGNRDPYNPSGPNGSPESYNPNGSSPQYSPPPPPSPVPYNPSNTPPCEDRTLWDTAFCKIFKDCPRKPDRCTQIANSGYSATVLQDLRARRVNDKRYTPTSIAESALSSVSATPAGPRGERHHRTKCDAGKNPQVKAMIAKGAANIDPIIDGSIRKRLGELGKEEAAAVRKLEEACRRILPSDRARFIDASGGTTIPLQYKERCDLQGYFEAEAAKATSAAQRKIAAGEFFSTIMGKLLSAEWPDAVDFCANVCRSKERGTAVTRCVIGCAETTLQNCWSQCSAKACKSGCRRTHWWAWRKLLPCISHCNDICTYD